MRAFCVLRAFVECVRRAPRACRPMGSIDRWYGTCISTTAQPINKHIHYNTIGALLYEMLTGLPPFYCRDREKLFEKIRTAELTFPKFVSAPARCVSKGSEDGYVYGRGWFLRGRLYEAFSDAQSSRPPITYNTDAHARPQPSDPHTPNPQTNPTARCSRAS